MEGFGERSYNNLIESLDKARETTAVRVLYSLGIANIGLATAKLICRYFNNDFDKIIKAKEANIQRTLAGKQKAIQAAAANFQQNVQANKYTQAQAQQIQASIQKQAQDADALQQRLGAEYQNEVAKYNKALSDSVHNYLKEYNKDKKYAIILAKSGDNILYADPAYNITNEVVKGMNQAYKGMSK